MSKKYVSRKTEIKILKMNWKEGRKGGRKEGRKGGKCIFALRGGP